MLIHLYDSRTKTVLAQITCDVLPPNGTRFCIFNQQTHEILHYYVTANVPPTVEVHADNASGLSGGASRVWMAAEELPADTARDYTPF